MKQIWLSIFLLYGSLSLFAQQKPAKLSLNQHLDSALQNNYLLQASRFRKAFGIETPESEAHNSANRAFVFFVLIK